MIIIPVHITLIAFTCLILISAILIFYLLFIPNLQKKQLFSSLNLTMISFFFCICIILFYGLMYAFSFGAFNLQNLIIKFPWFVKNIVIFPFFIGFFTLGLSLGLFFLRSQSRIIQSLSISLLAIILFISFTAITQWRSDLDLIFNPTYPSIAATSNDNAQLQNLYERVKSSYDPYVYHGRLIELIASNKNIDLPFSLLIFNYALTLDEYYKNSLIYALSTNPQINPELQIKIISVLPEYQNINIGTNTYQSIASNPNSSSATLDLLYKKIENVPLTDNLLSIKNVFYALISNPNTSADLLKTMYQKLNTPQVTYYDTLFAQNQNTPPEVINSIIKKLTDRFPIVAKNREQYPEERGAIVSVIPALLKNPAVTDQDKQMLRQLPMI